MMSSFVRCSGIAFVLLMGTVLTGCGNPTQEPVPPAAPGQKPPPNQNATPAANTKVPPPPNAPEVPFGFIDAAQGKAVVGGELAISGWAADYQDGVPVTKVEILLDDAVVAQATLGKERPDVATAHSNPNWRNAGWEAVVPLANAKPGRHTITAVAYDSGGLKNGLNSPQKIEVAAK